MPENVKYLDLTGLQLLISKLRTRKELVVHDATAAAAAAVKVGCDANGHVVLGGSLGKGDVGLGNVVNTGDSATPTSGGTTKFTTGGAYTLKTTIDNHTGNTSNPHSVTKAQVGLGNVNNTAITVSATDGVTDSTNNKTYKYTHPTTTAATAAAVKVGKDALGHVELGSALTASDVGLGNVANTNITVSATNGVKDVTNNVTYKYTHPSTTAADAAAVKVGKDSSGHVVLGDALTKADVGLGNVLNKAITVTSTSVSDGTNTFNKYSHPSYDTAAAAAVKVGRDSTGHVTIGSALTYGDIANTPTIGNGTLTIQANGTSKGTFTANATGNTTVNITASDLGLSGAMHFIGVLESLPTPTTSDTYNNGDVVIVGKKEYVRNGKTASAAGSWVELGDESSFALKTTKIQAGTGLTITAGGTLNTDTTIALATNGTEASAAAVKVGRDAYGRAIIGSALSIGSNGAHTHDVKIPANTYVVSVSASTTKISLNKKTATVVTSYPGATSKLNTTSIKGVAGIETVHNASYDSTNERLVLTAKTVATAASSNTTVATGSVSGTGGGATILTGLGTAETATALINTTAITNGSTGDVTVATGASGTKNDAIATFSDAAQSAGSHDHTIS